MPPAQQFSLSAGPLRLVLDWSGDRFRQRILMIAGGDLKKGVTASAPATCQTSPEFHLLESIEGSPDDAWPDSPPLQECHVESRLDGRQVALLVGRAGRSHWSLSVLADTTEQSLLFEAACRLKDRPKWLGSRYRLLPLVNAAADLRATHVKPTTAFSALFECPSTGQQWRLPASQAEPPGTANTPRLVTESSPAESLGYEAETISVAAPADELQAARTLRWSYLVRVTS